MAFTSASVTRVEQGTAQFQGVFSELWECVLACNPSSVAAGAEDTQTFTIPGVALGDMVLGVATGVSWTASGEASIEAWVSAANTLTVRISNLHATNAVDLGTSNWKVLIGRPNW